MVKILKVGDIIRIKNGMCVNARVPECVFYESKLFSQKTTHAVVRVGKVYKSSSLSKEKVLEQINNFLVSKFDVSISDKELKEFVDKLQIDYTVKTFDTSFLEGEYVVYDAGFLEKRIAPYQVLCYKKDNPDIKIMFYQRCPFYKANISEEIEVIGNISK